MSDTPANSLPQTLPIFPLQIVLFPASRLSLRIFEARYMDMVATCMREESEFGVCLIVEGQEVGTPAVPHKVGVSARVVDWDMSQPGLLGITVRGMRRFRIVEHRADTQGLVRAAVRWLDEAPATALSATHQQLVPLLQAVAADGGAKVMPPPHHFDDPSWIGYRYAEILPIPPLARQRLLELDDPVMRLDIIQQFLGDRGLLKPAG
ncbi:LON peptidase substrate-binding domain-containing protein [Uliginosibacterium sp. H1]|uniref:LON peptidase substrate-binding domain-containing protein n=1 Tax=Uliginosibacterium sp. H1 TaxID=3114757 RepID=UPI002E179FDA|nr:LON peptidase substrate-binding domain-containing protein [Uliginosibacterium sp. H1]